MAVDSKFGQLEIPGIPEDEPVFVIRAKDAISAMAVSAYKDIRLNQSEPPSEEFVDHLDDEVSKFVLWQADNPELVKLPD